MAARELKKGPRASRFELALPLGLILFERGAALNDALSMILCRAFGDGGGPVSSLWPWHGRGEGR